MPRQALQKPSTLSDSAFDRLREAIVGGELAPGAKINEPQLSRQFGISRGPLREAIRRLEGCKLVEIKPNVGARVVALTHEQVNEIYEIRESLEGLACRLAAARAGPEGCQRLRQLLTEHERQIESAQGRQYDQREGDLDFHFLIVQLSANSRLFNLLCGELYHLVRLCRAQTSSVDRRPVQAFREHHQIVDALERGDGELAELLMKRHISGAKEIFLTELNQAVTNYS